MKLSYRQLGLFLFNFFFIFTLLCADEYDDCCDDPITTGDYDYDDYTFEHFQHGSGSAICGVDCHIAKECGLCGIWLPEDPVLFRPFLADPRKVCLSAGWRFNDQVLAKNVIDVSYGDNCALYRWFDIEFGPFCGQLQIELEGALWAVFDPLHESAPLVNADYYVGIPVTYSCGNWSFRLRGFHISSHIGDEFLLNNLDRGFIRTNPSAEYLDFAVSNDFTDELRFYGLAGVIVHQDQTFKTGRLYFEAGMEVRMHRLGFENYCQQLYGEPFFAWHWRWNDVFKHHVDMTYVLGYEIGKTCGLCRKLRFYMEYHDGYSVEGQFAKFPCSYLAFRASYGF